MRQDPPSDPCDPTRVRRATGASRPGSRGTEGDRPLGPSAPRARRRAGFSLVEMLLAMIVMAIAMIGLSGSVVATLSLNRVNRETTAATEGARRMIETIADTSQISFPEIYRAYNGEPSDDPAGVGTAQGEGFEVEGLAPRADDPDGLVGRVRFPTLVNGAGEWELREDIVDPGLGMPRDLNGDGLVDAEDHSDDYILLPVTVVVEWQGVSGNRALQLQTMIAEW